MSEMSFEEPTAALRFVRRDGKLILQQTIAIKKFSTMHRHQIGQVDEWRDVPIADDPQ